MRSVTAGGRSCAMTALGGVTTSSGETGAGSLGYRDDDVDGCGWSRGTDGTVDDCSEAVWSILWHVVCARFFREVNSPADRVIDASCLNPGTRHH